MLMVPALSVWPVKKPMRAAVPPAGTMAGLQFEAVLQSKLPAVEVLVKVTGWATVGS